MSGYGSTGSSARDGRRRAAGSVKGSRHVPLLQSNGEGMRVYFIIKLIIFIYYIFLSLTRT